MPDMASVGAALLEKLTEIVQRGGKVDVKIAVEPKIEASAAATDAEGLGDRALVASLYAFLNPATGADMRHWFELSRPDASSILDALSSCTSRIGELLRERDALQKTFDLRWAADMRAIDRWQAETGRELVWPDRADLCVWLLEKLTAATAKIEQLEGLFQSTHGVHVSWVAAADDRKRQLEEERKAHTETRNTLTAQRFSMIRFAEAVRDWSIALDAYNATPRNDEGHDPPAERMGYAEARLRRMLASYDSAKVAAETPR